VAPFVALLCIREDEPAYRKVRSRWRHPAQRGVSTRQSILTVIEPSRTAGGVCEVPGQSGYPPPIDANDILNAGVMILVPPPS
jgi:hypothetical protein